MRHNGPRLAVCLAACVALTLVAAAPAFGAFDHLATFGGLAAGTGNGQFSGPAGVTTDAAGNVLVADTANYRIQKLSPTGAFISKWGRNGGDGSAGTANGELTSPFGLAATPSGNLYVSEVFGNRVQEFGPTAAFLRKWGGLPGGSGDGQFALAFGLALDGGGNVYVADGANNLIQKFTPNGVFLAKWGKNGGAGGAGSAGSGDGEFNQPTGLTFDSAGDLYVADQQNNRIQKFGDSNAAAPPYPPLLSGVTVSPSRFRVDPRGAAARRRAPKGTAFAFKLDQPATVTYTLKRRSRGRKVGGRCVKQTRANRRRRRCTRFSGAGSFNRPAAKGQNRQPFSGKVGTRKLKPASYRATLVARNAAGLSSAPASVRFTVVRR